MTWVKVCGLTRRADVDAAVAAGADAVGFVLDPRSPRSVALTAVVDLIAEVAATTVLVTVDWPADRLDELAATGADAIQPHGRDAAALAARAVAHGLRVLRPRGVGPEVVDLHDIPDDQIPLLDAKIPGAHGGTGVTFDWSLIGDPGRPFVLAGGLGPDNVAAAIEAVRPWGVDASSRLEQAPGIKDAGKVAAFIAEAKTA